MVEKAESDIGIYVILISKTNIPFQLSIHKIKLIPTLPISNPPSNISLSLKHVLANTK